eukprot:gene8100-9624_t
MGGTFVPVRNSEIAHKERTTSDDKAERAHRAFDNPHTLHRGLAPEDSSDRDLGQQVVRKAPTMIKNEKGLWVKPDKETLAKMKAEWEDAQKRERDDHEAREREAKQARSAGDLPPFVPSPSFEGAQAGYYFSTVTDGMQERKARVIIWSQSKAAARQAKQAGALLVAAPALRARATTRNPEVTTAIACAIATEVIDETGVESEVESGVEGGESETEIGIANTIATETIGNETRTVAGTSIVVATAAVSAAAGELSPIAKRGSSSATVFCLIVFRAFTGASPRRAAERERSPERRFQATTDKPAGQTKEEKERAALERLMAKRQQGTAPAVGGVPKRGGWAASKYGL